MLTPGYTNLFDNSQRYLGDFQQPFCGLNYGKGSFDYAGMSGGYLFPCFVFGQEMKRFLFRISPSNNLPEHTIRQAL